MTKKFDLSRDEDALCNFVMNVEPTGGGDCPECYELVLHEARDMSWTDGSHKAFLVIGDDVRTSRTNRRTPCTSTGAMRLIF